MLVLAAVREELGELRGYTVGIGPVAAAAATAALLAEHRPSAVVLVGTCGAYPGGPAIGTVIAAARVGLAFGVAAMGLGYVPRPPAPIACDPQLLTRIGIPHVPVLTCGAVTTDPVLASRLADGWACEHLEAFGVATACLNAGVPFVAVLGVANDVGPSAHAEWLANRELAQDAARETVRALIAPAEVW